MEKNKIIGLIFLRMIPGLPYQIVSVIPLFFRMSITSYFMCSLVGSAPSKFLIVLLANKGKTKISEDTNFYLNFFANNYLSIIIFILFIFLLINVIKNTISKNVK